MNVMLNICSVTFHYFFFIDLRFACTTYVFVLVFRLELCISLIFIFKTFHVFIRKSCPEKNLFNVLYICALLKILWEGE